MKRLSRLVAVLSTLALLTGCAIPRPAVESLADLGPGDVVLVGRVKLTPPLEKGEQTESRGVLVPFDYRNLVLFAVDSKPRAPDTPPGVFTFHNGIKGKLEETFFVRVPQAPLYLVQGSIPLHYGGDDGRGVESAHLPAGFMVNIEPGDRAVYIGTIHYHRDEFWKITKVTIEDDYSAAVAEFRRKLGADTKLRKALLRVPTASPAGGRLAAERDEQVLARH